MRLIELFFLLLKSDRLSTREIAQHFNVSVKTIQRDLDKLTVLGIPVIIHRGINGGVEIEKTYSLKKGVLNNNEFNFAMLALYIGNHLVKNDIFENLIKKILLVSGEKAKSEIKDFEKYIVLDITDKKLDLESNLHSEIIYCIKYKKVIEVYIDSNVYMINPIKYVLKDNGLHLYAKLDDRFILIPIDKIKTINVKDQVFNEEFTDYINNKANIEIL
ncbi:helix-turn-helix transcriptional regulator [Paraclostridium sordellii]|uniref:helix-turn-helix transcriptional regulator n=1 Tax=Paraclostridium sordellii TaxID=1505 RepID=UPI0005E6FBD1|nr:HTH domain-containing protein [Paeniclostridium sordellii]CEN90219.1 helix-turn-helix type 11 domain-containing protein [[Clostridium] sordellii] [Paeniclostridium sordellii]